MPVESLAEMKKFLLFFFYLNSWYLNNEKKI